jgi:hypothetical protein
MFSSSSLMDGRVRDGTPFISDSCCNTKHNDSCKNLRFHGTQCIFLRKELNFKYYLLELQASNG